MTRHTRAELLRAASDEVYAARRHFAHALVCGVANRHLAALSRLLALDCIFRAMRLRDEAREHVRLDALYEALPLVATHGPGPEVVDATFDVDDDPWGLLHG